MPSAGTNVQPALVELLPPASQPDWALMRLALLALSLLALAAPTAAQAATDRDRDRLPDRWEKRFHISTAKASAEGDPDRDRVDNLNERRQGTNPRDRDSDNDRRPDGREDRDGDALSNAAEDLTGNDPVDRDTDDDGVRDGAERAGTVASLQDGELTIRLARGGVLRGFVDDSTVVGCSSERRLEAGRSHKQRRRGQTTVGHAAQGPEDEPLVDEEPFEDEDPFGEESELDPFEDAPLEDVDEEAEAERESDDFEEAAIRPCGLSRLRRGVRVHQAKVKLTADGLYFTQIQLLR